MRISVIRRAHFNAAHRLYRPDWSEERNRQVFGLCSNPNFHGHNYELEVCVTGEIDEETGMVINLKDLKRIIYEEVEQRFDHKNLNLDVEEFKELIPTSEHFCHVIWKRLRAALPSKFDLQVRLYETPRNFFEYPPRS